MSSPTTGGPASLFRVFYAHKKQEPDELINERTRSLSALFRANNPGGFIEIVSGRDSFRARALAAGGWPGWTRELVRSTDTWGKPVYAAFVIPDEYVGRVTSVIVQDAIAWRRKVLWWDGQTTFAPVVGIVKVSSSQTDGWQLQLGA